MLFFGLDVVMTDYRSTALARIVEKLPVDPSVLDDTIEANLCKGNIIQVRYDIQQVEIQLTLRQ